MRARYSPCTTQNRAMPAPYHRSSSKRKVSAAKVKAMAHAIRRLPPCRADHTAASRHTTMVRYFTPSPPVEKASSARNNRYSAVSSPTKHFFTGAISVVSFLPIRFMYPSYGPSVSRFLPMPWQNGGSPSSQRRSAAGRRLRRRQPVPGSPLRHGSSFRHGSQRPQALVAGGDAQGASPQRRQHIRLVRQQPPGDQRHRQLPAQPP